MRRPPARGELDMGIVENSADVALDLDELVALMRTDGIDVSGAVTAVRIGRGHRTSRTSWRICCGRGCPSSTRTETSIGVTRDPSAAKLQPESNFSTKRS